MNWGHDWWGGGVRGINESKKMGWRLTISWEVLYVEGCRNGRRRDLDRFYIIIVA